MRALNYYGILPNSVISIIIFKKIFIFFLSAFNVLFAVFAYLLSPCLLCIQGIGRM